MRSVLLFGFMSWYTLKLNFQLIKKLFMGIWGCYNISWVRSAMCQEQIKSLTGEMYKLFLKTYSNPSVRKPDILDAAWYKIPPALSHCPLIGRRLTAEQDRHWTIRPSWAAERQAGTSSSSLLYQGTASPGLTFNLNDIMR